MFLPLQTTVALAQQESTKHNGGQLSLEAIGSEFTLGEMVSLSARLENTGEETLVIPGDLSVETGQLKIFVSYRDEPFKQYRGPAWGLLDVCCPIIRLAKGQYKEKQITVLHHTRMRTAHLSEMYAKRIELEDLPDEYVLSRPGPYRLKAMFYQDPVTKIESEAVSITVQTPTGPDNEIWQYLRKSPSVGYMIQTGEWPTDNKGEEHNATLRIRELLEQYPQSVYEKDLKSGIARYTERHSRDAERR